MIQFVLSSIDPNFVYGFLVATLIFLAPRFAKRRLLHKDVEKAFSMVRMVCEPQILDPEKMGNPDFMRSQSRDLVNGMLKKLKSAGFYPPNRCDGSDESLKEWFEFLQMVRSDLMPWFFKSSGV